MNKELKIFIDNLPNKTGCYIYYNQNNQIIYVGKAKNINKRVSSYFKNPKDIKTTRLVRDIDRIEYILVKNESESFILEQNLIKKHRPKYNILLNDDKAYPYISITNENDPQYKYLRKFSKKNIKNYGPFPLGSSAKKVMNILEKIFPLRACKGNIGHPCLYYEINQCSGACFKEVDQSYYSKTIKNIDNFFKGKVEFVESFVKNKMIIAADNLQFEEAQRNKDILDNLKNIIFKQNVNFNFSKNIDVIDYKINEKFIVILTLFYRSGKLLSKDEHVQEYFGQDISELVSTYINNLYSKNIIPDKILIDDTLNIFIDNSEVMSKIKLSNSKIEKEIKDIAKDNANNILQKTLLSSQSVNFSFQEILNSLQIISKSSKFPNHIEMFDISNLGNELVVGCCVVYKNGLPVKSEFRKYNINIEEDSDYHRMSYMILKRFSKKILEKENLPDLIIADGGMIQIHAIKEQLEKLELKNIDVIGLVKDDNHKTDYLIDTMENSNSIKDNKKLFNFLSQIQIEVDKFAKNFLNKRNKDIFFKSDLLNVKGLSQTKLNLLISKFNSLNTLKKASFEELNEIINNKNTTNNLLSYLKKDK